MLFYIIIGILLFGFLIFIHELGHFLCARAFGVGIQEFAIGMGPKIFSRTGKDGIAYSLRLFPIGGFVSMVGEDEASDDERAINKKPAWQRLIIMAAGAIMNIILGFLVMALIVVFSGKFYTSEIVQFRVVDEQNQYVTTYQGMEIGDVITRVGKQKIHVRSDLVYAVMRAGADPTDVTVLRDGKEMVITGVRFPTFTDNGIVFGNASFFIPAEQNRSIGTVIHESFFQSISAMRMIWSTLFDTIGGKYGGTEAVSGPVGVISEIQSTAKSGGLGAVAYLLAIISLNVGMFNLLPLPALDGGRIVFLLIEVIRKKPIKPEIEGYIHFAGLVVLMLFMVFITYQDIAKLIFK